MLNSYCCFISISEQGAKQAGFEFVKAAGGHWTKYQTQFPWFRSTLVCTLVDMTSCLKIQRKNILVTINYQPDHSNIVDHSMQ